MSSTDGRVSTPAKSNRRSIPPDDGRKGNVQGANSKTVAIADTQIINGTAGASARSTLTANDYGRSSNHKRKLGVSNGSSYSAMSSGPSRPRSPAGTIPPTTALGGPTSLPPRPSSATVAAGGISTPSAPRADRQRHVPPHLKGRSRGASPHSSSREASASLIPLTGVSARSTADDIAQPSTKKAKADLVDNAKDGGRTALGSGSSGAGGLNVRGAAGRGQANEIVSSKEEPKVIPSLLRRLAGDASIRNTGVLPPTLDHEQSQKGKEWGQGQGRRNKRERDEARDRPKSSTPSVVPAKRHADASSPPAVPASRASSASVLISGRTGLEASPADPDKDPVAGFSIRGAAKAASGAWSATEGAKWGSGSLLERLQAGDTVASEMGGKRRKRTKHS